MREAGKYKSRTYATHEQYISPLPSNKRTKVAVRPVLGIHVDAILNKEANHRNDGGRGANLYGLVEYSIAAMVHCGHVGSVLDQHPKGLEEQPLIAVKMEPGHCTVEREHAAQRTVASCVLKGLDTSTLKYPQQLFRVSLNGRVHDLLAELGWVDISRHNPPIGRLFQEPLSILLLLVQLLTQRGYFLRVCVGIPHSEWWTGTMQSHLPTSQDRAQEPHAVRDQGCSNLFEGSGRQLGGRTLERVRASLTSAKTNQTQG